MEQRFLDQKILYVEHQTNMNLNLWGGELLLLMKNPLCFLFSPKISVHECLRGGFFFQLNRKKNPNFSLVSTPVLSLPSNSKMTSC